MSNKMLFGSVLLLLTACGETTTKEKQTAAAQEPIVERSAVSNDDPDLTQQEIINEAEARGAAQANAAIQRADDVDHKRQAGGD